MNSAKNVELIASPLRSGRIDVLVPRCLVGNGKDVLGTSIDQEGLSSIQVEWRDGSITSIKGLKETSKVPEEILLPRFVEPHSHIDKAFSWSRSSNLRGSYHEALAANLIEYELRSNDELIFSIEKSLDLALVNGIRAIRSHIDSFGKTAMRDWDLLENIGKKRFWEILENPMWETNLESNRFWKNRLGKIGNGSINRQGYHEPPIIPGTVNCEPLIVL